MTNPTLGDVDGNGVREVADIVILQKYIHGVETFTAAAFNRSDLNGDHMVDVNDLGLLKRYILYSSPAPALTGYSYFYCISDPMKKDSDGDLDLDNADPNPMEYQLNGYFAEKMGELQSVAQEYLGDYSEAKGDVYYNLKDVWLVFYYLRSFEKGYTDSKWTKTAGADTKFISFVNNNEKYDELQEYFKSTEYIYANSEKAKIGLAHLSAVVSGLLYYPTINELLPSNANFLEILGANFLLNRREVNEKLDTLSGWGGDLQQLMNDAYDAMNDNTISENVYDLLGRDGTHFSLDDLYADIDAEIISKNITAMYTNRTSFDSNTLITEVINNCYNQSEAKRYATFSELVDLNFDTVLSAEKIDIASEYDLDDSYRIFKHPKNITDEDFEQIASAFIEKLDAIFKED